MYFWVRTKNSSKLQRLGPSLSRDFPCLFTHHNFANRLRDKINETFYCNRILQGSPERPSVDLVGDDTQVNYWTSGDGRALSFSNTICKIISRLYIYLRYRSIVHLLAISIDRTSTCDIDWSYISLSAISIVHLLHGERRPSATWRVRYDRTKRQLIDN